MDETRSRRKRRRDSSPPSLDVASFDRNVFPLLLAAASSRTTPNEHSRSVLRRFLRARLALISSRPSSCTSPQPLLPDGLIALLPLLLTSRWPSVARLSADVVRSAALYSIEMNTVLALNGEIVKGLVLALGNGRRRVAKTVCNAVLDLSISQVGREQLCKALSVERLLWEGFAHVALHCWHEKQKEVSDCITSMEARRRKIFSVFLLHVAIKLIADDVSIFRKACLIAAKFVEHHADTLRLNQKANFLKIINVIDFSSNFTETFEKTVVQEANDNFLEWMRWLRHLPQRGDEDEKIDFDDPSRMWSEIIELSSKGNEEMKDEFFQTKSRFCRSLVYEEACRMFQLTLENYRRTRNQYTNGMLALHTA